MRRSNVGSANAVPDSIIPARGHLSENISRSTRKERCDVFHDDDAGSKLANDAREFSPQATALTREASALPSERQVLAGEAATEHVDAGGVGADVSNIGKEMSRGPVSGEDAAAPRVRFALPRRFAVESRITKGLLKPEIQTADAAEE
jgi:hypothetical protein